MRSVVIRRPARSAVAALGLTLLLLGSACSGDDSPSTTTAAAPDRAAVFEALAEQVIVPAYEDLATSTEALAVALTALCDDPSAEEFGAARSAWDEAQGAWMRTRAFRFGPVARLRASGKIAYAVDATKLEALFSTPGELPDAPTPEDVGGLGADVRGLEAIDHLLFTPADVTALEPRACTYAESAARLVATAAQDVLVGWTEGSELSSESGEPFVEQFANTGGDSMFADDQEVVDELVNTTIGTLDEVGDMQLGLASGQTSGTPEPSEADPRPAHRLRSDMVDALTSVSSLYGTVEGPDLGLAALVAARSGSTATSTGTTLDAALDSLDELPDPVATIDPTDTAAVDTLVAAHDAVAAARVAFRAEVASLLGVTISFSDADGDA